MPQPGTLFWAYTAQGLNVAGGLVLMPAALFYLPTEHVAIWYMFLAAVTLGNILDFGLSPTISRFAAYAMAGATTFYAQGHDLKISNSIPNYSLLKKLYKDTSRLYWLLGLAAFVVLGPSGALYLSYVGEANSIKSMHEIYFAWTGYAVAISIYLGFLYFSPFLQGTGKLKQSYRAIALSRASIVVLGLATLLCGMGLPGLALSHLIGIVIGIALTYRGLCTSKTWIVVRKIARCESEGATYRNIFPNSWRAGVLGLSAFMITKSTVLIAGAYLPLAESAQYALMMQVLWVLMSLSLVYFNSNIPRFANKRVSSKNHELRDDYFKILKRSLMLYTLLVALFLFVGIDILSYLNTTATDLDYAVLIVASAMIGLELNHSMAAGFIMTRNEVPMVPSAVISGLATVGLAIFGLITFPDLALWMLVLAQLLVQLTYNNWKWPLEVKREFAINV